MHHLGIDPGGPGAAVLLDEQGAAALALCWKGAQRSGRRVWLLSGWVDGRTYTEQVEGRESAIAAHLAALLHDERLRFRVCCEDVFLHRRTPNLKTTVKLARWGGLLVSPLEILSDSSAAFVQAGRWRQSVLGISPYTKRETAKLASLDYIPRLVPGMAEVVEALGDFDHLTDAAGIALWHLRQSAT